MIPQLKNWNTIVGFLAVGVVGVLWNVGWIDDSTAKWILTALVPYTGISLRSAITKP